MINFMIAHLNRAGGMETATVSTANELVKRGFKARIITTAQQDDVILPVYDIDPRVEIHHFRLPRALCLPDLYMDDMLKRKMFWAPLIIIFNFLLAPFRLLFWKKRFNKLVKPGEKVIVSCNEGLYLIGKKTINYHWMHFAAERAWWERKFSRMNKSKLYGLIMMTETDARYMSKIKAWRNTKIFHALNMTRFKLPMDLENKKAKLVFIGRITLQKSPLKIVELAKLLKEKGLDFSIEMYGDGTENMKIKLKNKIVKDKMQNYVKYMGKTNDACKVLCESDGLVLVSRLEGLPMVVQEAKICSAVPMVLKWGQNTNEAIIDGESGIVATSLQQLADKIAFTLRSKERLESLKENAYEHAKLTYPENVIEIWINEILK